MTHTLPPLLYDYAALQPWIDETTMRIHHDCHHQACVDTLNAVEARLAAARTTEAQRGGDCVLIRYLQQLTAVYATEHALHSLFWENMGPNQGGQPTDELADQIAQDFGSFAAFKIEFCAAATSVEASGWVVLVWQPKREQLAIRSAESHQAGTECVGAALLVLDMCEHAYYLKYQDRRAEYAHNWWNTVNWPCVAGRFIALTRTARRPTDHHASKRPQPTRRHRDASRTHGDCVSHIPAATGDSFLLR